MLPEEKDIVTLNILSPMLKSFLEEMKEFSKKNPNDKLNELKIKLINKILTQIKELLKNEPSVLYLDILDDETLPSNSDTVLILTQYKSALENFKFNYYYSDDRYLSSTRWHTTENP